MELGEAGHSEKAQVQEQLCCKAEQLALSRAGVRGEVWGRASCDITRQMLKTQRGLHSGTPSGRRSLGKVIAAAQAR